MRVLTSLLNRRGMMFCGTFHEFFCFLLVAIIACCTCGENIGNKNDEYVRNDFSMCLNSFDIHKNKIIQTEDSIEMGAKYLNETDVNAREECLALCCKTERCDVFIFEEKKPGSCYLFQCGPLHNFKCKFTSHGNYTSAVRTSYNKQEEELRISQQEHELKSLRKLADSPPEYTAFTMSPMKAVTQTSKLLPTTPMPVRQGCSRNQFECRSSGECIAIYNVCDGIPQCTDGSDEAAELVCPTEKPTVVPQLAIQHPLMSQLPSNMLKYQQMLDQRKPIPPFIYPHGMENNPRPWDLTNSIHPVMSQQQSLMYPAQQVEIPELRKNFGPQGYQWNYQPLYEQAKENYKVPNGYQETANFNIYDRDQSHISAHQKPRVVETNDLNGSEGVLSDPNRPSHLPIQNVKTLQRNHVQLQSPATVASNEVKKSNIVQESIKTTTAVPCEVETVSKNKEPTKVEQEISKDTVQQKINNHNAEKPSSNANLKQNHQQPGENKDYKNKASIVNENVKEHHITTITGHLRLVHEEENLHPKGAVVSLALGLTVTAITAALIACRLRVVRRRSRRGQGPYAHDADYLVNGMYL